MGLARLIVVALLAGTIGYLLSALSLPANGSAHDNSAQGRVIYAKTGDRIFMGQTGWRCWMYRDQGTPKGVPVPDIRPRTFCRYWPVGAAGDPTFDLTSAYMFIVDRSLRAPRSNGRGGFYYITSP